MILNCSCKALRCYCFDLSTYSPASCINLTYRPPLLQGKDFMQGRCLINSFSCTRQKTNLLGTHPPQPRSKLGHVPSSFLPEIARTYILICCREIVYNVLTHVRKTNRNLASCRSYPKSASS